ncbi:protein-methionine-sulfoxide reductase heme-binding subunit MsrQ [Roseomonas populi]|uniref:Protein-methionine-sulfoxide reductase heme-binding subunit MsrQ n=1 Tax=Roseomonas populi TaxID=3121582 RepID=A0ABT1WZM1_9PROT|nr:protein-methionine-sulfoxide reductase heme-binding subunit MsrQ [Roseomonas pecuniae]MCR0981291.1 sulfoxide reductase heme-binding subunit YedZ [Roseomonas pecuniae]
MSEAALPSAAARPRRARRDGPPPPKPGPWPWLDRGGRFSVFKSAVLLGCLAPALWVAWLWATDSLGPEPLKLATHETGDWCVRFLLISLAVTPARWVLDWQRAVQVRRMLGLTALFYGLAHLALYIGNENFRLWHVLLEIVRRPYLSIGFTALIGLAVLGWTSTDTALRRLGREWKPLHRLAYPLVALGILHFYIQSKINVSEPVLMTGFFLFLMLWRLVPARWRGLPWPLFAIAPLAAAGAAGVEYLWYALATNLPAAEIFKANFDLEFEVRPSVWVLVAGLAAAALSGIWWGVRQVFVTGQALPRPRALRE